MFNLLTNPSIDSLPINARICIYGAGKIGIAIRNKFALERPDIKFKFFVDSYKTGELDDYKIIKVDDLSKIRNEFDYIVIGSDSHKFSIVEILKKYNFDNYILPDQILDKKTLISLIEPINLSGPCINKYYKDFILSVMNSPLYRTFCENLTNRKIVLICNFSDIQDVKKFLSQFTNLEIQKIYFTGYFTGYSEIYPSEIEIDLADKKVFVPTSSLACFNYYEHKDLFAFFKSSDVEVYLFLEELRKAGISTFDYYCPQPNNYLQSKPNEDYLLNNLDLLHNAYNLLEDKHSKDVFSSRVKMILTGDSGYLKISPYEEYYTSHAKPESGDVIIDAGVSQYVEYTLAFSNAVGNDGKVFAFEPEPWCFEEAKIRIEQRAELQNIELLNYGLWNKREQQFITQCGNGSSIVSENIVGPKNVCELITLDDFVAENDIKKLDFIKMDIEGAEPNAIAGSVNTLKKFKPKLGICVYHNPKHLFDFILFINSLHLGYKFYLDHHLLYLYETVLYAEVEK